VSKPRDYRIRTSLENSVPSGGATDIIAYLMSNYSQHRAVTIWLDRCDAMTAAMIEREFLDQIEARKRDMAVESNIDRIGAK
jgi:hypothetical protein